MYQIQNKCVAHQILDNDMKLLDNIVQAIELKLSYVNLIKDEIKKSDEIKAPFLNKDLQLYNNDINKLKTDLGELRIHLNNSLGDYLSTLEKELGNNE